MVQLPRDGIVVRFWLFMDYGDAILYCWLYIDDLVDFLEGEMVHMLFSSVKKRTLHISKICTLNKY